MDDCNGESKEMNNFEYYNKGSSGPWLLIKDDDDFAEWEYDIDASLWYHWHNKYQLSLNEEAYTTSKDGYCKQCDKRLPKQHKMLALLQRLS